MSWNPTNPDPGPVGSPESPSQAQYPAPPQAYPSMYGYPGPGPMAPAKKTNGLAVAALVLGIVGVPLFWLWEIPPILALIFGLVSYSQIRKSEGRQGGEGMAITGIVLGALVIIFGVFFLLVFATHHRLSGAGPF